jgi:hypothetical protein
LRKHATILTLACLLALSAAAALSCGPGKDTGTGTTPQAEIYGMHFQPQLQSSAEEVFAEMESLGVRWVRWNTHWLTLEPAAGSFDWRSLDAIVAAATKHNLKLLITLRAISTWGSTRVPVNLTGGGYHATSPPKSTGQYNAWVTATTSHYKGKVAAWQIENEPNAKAFWDGTRDEYISLLKAGYTAAHTGDPGAVVLPAGLACGFSNAAPAEAKKASIGEWFNAILDSKAYDALDLHDYYPPETPNAWGITFEDYIGWERRWIKTKGFSPPLWMSEAGVSSEPVNVGGQSVGFTPEKQAADLGKVYAQAAANGIAHVFWIKLVDRAEQAFSFMGLETRSREPKPAFSEYQKIAGRQP